MKVYHSVVEILEVTDGVGGHNHGLLRSDVCGHHLLQGMARLYVQTVGRFVEKEYIGFKRQRISHLGFLAIAGGHILQRSVGVKSERGEIVAQGEGVEMRIERSMDSRHLAD